MTAQAEAELVVVGAGIAGLAAALAARRAGADVLVFDGPVGGSVLSAGAWDVAGRAADPDPLVATPRLLEVALAEVAEARPTHPWARLPRATALAAIRQAHAALAPCLGMRGSVETHADGALLVSELGLARRAAFAPHAVLDLAALPRARVAVAWMRALRTFDGRFVAASLGEQAVRCGDARRFVAVEVEMFRRAGDATSVPHEPAAVLDAVAARERMAMALSRALGGASFDAVLVPPVLGLAEEGVRAALEAAVKLPVGEPLQLPSGAGSLRLARRIARALEQAGAAYRRARVERVRANRGSVLVLLPGGETVRARAVVLATGKHVGGGIEMHGGRPRETLAGLPIWSGARPLARASGRTPLFGDEPSRPGEGFSLGVGWDEQLRPLDAHGRVVSPDLFACGALLEGVALHDGTAAGVAAATGWLAGLHAAARARR